MGNEQQQWAQCLQMIKERIGNERVYNTWFADISLERYDEQENTITMRVPSKYVYEYLEQYCVKLLAQVLANCFKPDLQLRYRILREPSFTEVAEYLRQQGYDSLKDPYHIAIPNGRKRLEDGLRYFMGEKAQWLPCYDNVVDWMTDNKGRGLLCFGTPGTGKTLVCTKILPVILGNGGRPIPCVDASDVKSHLDELMRERIVIIDDLGKEPRKHFGNTDNSFFELCNNAERTGSLLIITTNLSTTPVSQQYRERYPQSIQERYGVEVLDRLKVITKTARFEGKSMRG